MVTSPPVPAPARRTAPLDASAPVRSSSLLHLWHLASLDAPTVAVAWTLAFAWCAHIQLPRWTPVLLGLATWTVYIADRLLDVMRVMDASRGHEQQNAPLRARHLFHWRHRRIFLPAATASAAAGACIAFHFMPLAIRERNSVLAVAALAYFTSVHHPWRRPTRPLRLRIPKELLVGSIFTVACAAPSWYRMQGHRAELFTPILLFVALAWLNCHAIELWESEAVPPTRHGIRGMALALAGAAMLAAAIAAAGHAGRASLLLSTAGCSGLLLALLDRFRYKLSLLTLRAFADLVLLTPLALIWLR